MSSTECASKSTEWLIMCEWNCFVCCENESTRLKCNIKYKACEDKYSAAAMLRVGKSAGCSVRNNVKGDLSKLKIKKQRLWGIVLLFWSPNYMFYQQERYRTNQGPGNHLGPLDLRERTNRERGGQARAFLPAE